MADDLEGVLGQLGSSVSHREIGATVAKLFEDVRAQTREAIERNLGRLSGPVLAAVPASPESPDSTSERFTRSGTGAPIPRRRRILLVTGGAVSALLILVLGVWLSGILSSDRPTTTAVEAVPVAPNVAPAPPAAEPVPAANQVPKDLASPTAVTKGSSNAGRAVPRRPSRASAPAGAASGTLPPPPVDCDHPFFVDANGIKKFRPECM
jgi:hypothetical protein